MNGRELRRHRETTYGGYAHVRPGIPYPTYSERPGVEAGVYTMTVKTYEDVERCPQGKERHVLLFARLAGMGAAALLHTVTFEEWAHGYGVWVRSTMDSDTGHRGGWIYGWSYDLRVNTGRGEQS